MKIVFLDIDGVLNNEEDIVYLHEINGGWENKDFKKIRNEEAFGSGTPFSKRNLNNLKYLIEETNAKIILTSTWRGSKESTDCFLKALDSIGIKDKYIGKTKMKYWDSNWGRGREITEWLEENKDKEVETYIIIDDDTDMHWEDCMEHFIHINGQVGLTHRDRQQAIDMLNQND